MTEPEKTSVEKLAETFEVLPPEKKNYILGYAEGLADALAAGGTPEEQTKAEQ